MRKPNKQRKTVKAVQWWYSEHRCPGCFKIPSDSYSVLSVSLNPEVSIFTVQVIIQCPCCNRIMVHAIENEKRLESIVDQYSKDWIDV